MPYDSPVLPGDGREAARNRPDRRAHSRARGLSTWGIPPHTAAANGRRMTIMSPGEALRRRADRALRLARAVSDEKAAQALRLYAISFFEEPKHLSADMRLFTSVPPM